METKGIDLTKCKGWNFKAKIHGTQCEGRIQVERGVVFLCQDRKDGAECQDMLGFKYSWVLLNGSKEALETNNVTDFEIVPRDPETYKDWQVGDRARIPRDNWSDSVYKEIIFRSGELVICKDGNGDISGGYTCGQLHRLGYRLVLTDIEQKIIEEKTKYEPQDGDVCYAKSTSGFYTIFVYNRCGLDRKTDFYVSFDSRGGLFYSGYAIDAHWPEELRPATDEEKQLLFDAMAKEGKRWNAEKKVVEDIPKPHEFKKGEPVLVRDNDENIWILSSFIQFIPTSCFHVTNGVRPSHWKQCIPYNERTMHLLGTSEDYKEGE